jgi:hypothetical protein
MTAKALRPAGAIELLRVRANPFGALRLFVIEPRNPAIPALDRTTVPINAGSNDSSRPLAGLDNALPSAYLSAPVNC